MLPLRIVETDRPEFDEPVVELWREDVFVGMVFWDGEDTIVQIYPDDDGDVHDLEVGDLIRVLDMAVRIVAPPDAYDDDEEEYLQGYVATAPEGEWDAEAPATNAVTAEFDSRVVYRADDGEGFYDRDTALELVARCAELGLAAVELDGFDLQGTQLTHRPELGVYVDAPAGIDWSTRAAAANGQVRATLESWPAAPSLVAALVIQQADGESFIA